ncbi:MAG TPA: OsmC family protein [Solirubrobacterales bacterium]
MNDAEQELMRSRVEATPAGGSDKAVVFEATGERVTMGMHGELAEFYGADPGQIEARASTLDFLVGAITACLLGTFRRALTARQVSFTDLVATGTGRIVLEKDVPMLRAVEVEYRLSGAVADRHEALQRAHAVHDRGCAVSRSVAAAIEIETRLILIEGNEDE